MRFIPFSPEHGVKVMQLLANHVDLTPESADKENHLHNIEYFQEAYIDDKCTTINFVSIDESGDDAINGFIAVRDITLQYKTKCKYITELYAENTARALEIAAFLVSSFERLLKTSGYLCVFIYPGSADAIAFWESCGFSLHLDKSTISNADQQRLLAYCKRISISH